MVDERRTFFDKMSNNLAKYRGQHGLTQGQLGKKIGISKAGVSHLEKKKIGPKSAYRCAKALNENPFAIMGTDALKALPKTEEDKKCLIEIIEAL